MQFVPTRSRRRKSMACRRFLPSHKVIYSDDLANEPKQGAFMNLACRLPVFLGVILSAGSLCYGATVTGTVKSPDGQPFAGAFVQAQNTRTRITTIAVSDSQGRYRADGLQAGDYRVQIRAVGYRADPQTGMHLTDGRNAPLDFALQKSAVRWNDLS